MQTDEEPEDGSLYDTLGVAENATEADIKRAYFRLVRQFRPDEHPEMFNRVKNAYDVIGDAKRRAEYDEMRRFGPQVKALTDEAGPLISDDPARAIRLLKQAAVLAPNLSLPRVLLGAAFMSAQEFQSAEHELRRLVEKEPSDAFLHCQLGRALWMLDRNAEAEQEVERAITLDPQMHNAYLLLSHIQQENDDIDKAIGALERAIALDGSEDFSDLDVLLRFLTIYVVEERTEDAARTEQRLWVVTPDDEDAIYYVLARLYDLSREFHKAGNHRGAYAVIKRATHPKQADTELTTAIRDTTKWLAVLSDAQKFCGDEAVPKPLWAFIYFKYLNEFDADAKDWDEQAAMDGALQAVLDTLMEDSVPYRTVLHGLQWRYPALAEDSDTLWDAIKNTLSEIDQGGAAPQGTPSGGGCAVILCTLAGAASLLGVSGWLLTLIGH